MNVPFETNGDGDYIVMTPADGMEPDEMIVTVMNTRYKLSGYAGKERSSVVHPDVLAYSRCEVFEE